MSKQAPKKQTVKIATSDLFSREEKLILLYLIYLQDTYETKIFLLPEEIAKQLMIGDHETYEAILNLEKLNIIIVEPVLSLLGFYVNSDYLLEYIENNGNISYC